MTNSEICGGLGENLHMEHVDGLITMIPCHCKNRLTTEWLPWLHGLLGTSG